MALIRETVHTEDVSHPLALASAGFAEAMELARMAGRARSEKPHLYDLAVDNAKRAFDRATEYATRSGLEVSTDLFRAMIAGEALDARNETRAALLKRQAEKKAGRVIATAKEFLAKHAPAPKKALTQQEAILDSFGLLDGI